MTDVVISWFQQRPPTKIRYLLVPPDIPGQGKELQKPLQLPHNTTGKQVNQRFMAANPSGENNVTCSTYETKTTN